MNSPTSNNNFFTKLYLKQPTVLAMDSSVFRRRLGAWLNDNLGGNDVYELSTYLEINAGIEIPANYNYRDVKKLFIENDIHQILDLITHVYNFFIKQDTSRSYHNTYKKSKWKDFVWKVLEEENLSYTVDSICVVHYKVDQEFEHNKQSTLAGLNNPKYKNIRSSFESAYEDLSKTPADTKDAVRSMFDSIESLVKQMVNKDQLNARIVRSDLKKLILEKYDGDMTAINSVAKVVESFADWVDGIHFYRHGQKYEEIVKPPLDFTVLIISTGSAYLRWLLEVNKENS